MATSDPAAPDERAAMGPPTGSVDADVLCALCGYNLRGLSLGGVCPECGERVERSFKGDFLQFAAPDYVTRLRRGTDLVQTGLIVMVLATIAMIGVAGYLRSTGGLGAPVPPGPAAPPLPWSMDIYFLQQLVGLASTILIAIGWWLLASPDPSMRGADKGDRVRRVVRGAVLVNAGVALVIPLAGPILPGPVFASLTLALAAAGFLAFAVAYFAEMKYLQWLAPRLPNVWVQRRSRRMMWLGPLLYTVGAVACGLGPLVALVLYYNLLSVLRTDLRLIEEWQSAGPQRDESPFPERST